MKAWIDLETTGLSHKENDIVEIACIVIDNKGKELGQFNGKCKPVNKNKITQKSLEITGKTLDDLLKYPENTQTFRDFISFLDQFESVLLISGYNISFDQKFLYEWFNRNYKQHLYHDFFKHKLYCVYKRAREAKQHLRTPNLKNETLAKHFNIPIHAHNALSDIQATIGIDKELEKILSKELEQRETKEQTKGFVDKKRKYIRPEYLILNGDGDIFIDKRCVNDPEAFKFVMKYIWEKYSD